MRLPPFTFTVHEPVELHAGEPGHRVLFSTGLRAVAAAAAQRVVILEQKELDERWWTALVCIEEHRYVISPVDCLAAGAANLVDLGCLLSERLARLASELTP